MKDISAAQLKEWYDNRQVIVIDVRDSWRYQKEHIPGVLSIPLESLPKLSQVDGVLPVVFHCQIGGATTKYVDKLAALGFANSYVLEGGLDAWKLVGGKTVVDNDPNLPILRQVQVVMGSLVVGSVLFSYFVSPYFNWLTLLLGGSLLFSGMTGASMLKRILQWLPYNR